MNLLTVTSHLEDHEKLKELLFGLGTQELDLNIVSPIPKALEGMLLRSKDGIKFNRALDTRIGNYSVKSFFEYLREKNADKDRKVSFLLKMSVFESALGIKDGKASLMESEGTEELDDDNDFVSDELVCIEALEREVSQKFPEEAKIEDVIEYFLNNCSSEVIEGARPKPNAIDMEYIWFFAGKCSSAIQYAVEVMEDIYRDQCSSAYGFSDKDAWCEGNWGAEYNVEKTTMIQEQSTDNPSIKTTKIWFEKQGREPVKWLDKLEAKTKEVGIRDFSAELSYVNDTNKGGRIVVPMQ